jgi:hypothetical protein
MKLNLAKLILGVTFLIACSEDPTLPPDDDLDGPISRPKSGFGSDGMFLVSKITFQSPLNPSRNVEIFYPTEINKPKPTLFFSHAFGGDNSDYYKGLLEFVAKKGYVIIFSPYPTNGVTVNDRYNILWESFKKAVTDYPNLIDKTRVGFLGHSFGGGASFGLAYKGFVDEGWGTNGRFIFAMAQWYSFQLTQSQLQNFPANTKLVTQVYDEDVVNDHRMAIDIFKNINIPDAEKDFIYVNRSTIGNYNYLADHGVPNTVSAFDAYDYYAIYRILDALIDYSLNGNQNAKSIALGGGSTEQITMPSYNGQALTPLEVTDNPSPKYSQSKYEYPCSNSINPRSSNCQ